MLQELDDQKAETRKTGKVLFAEAGRITVKKPKLRAMVAKARRAKAVAAGQIPEPKRTREALERDHKAWIPSIVETYSRFLTKVYCAKVKTTKAKPRQICSRWVLTSTKGRLCTLGYTTLTSIAVKVKSSGIRPAVLRRSIKATCRKALTSLKPLLLNHAKTLAESCQHYWCFATY